MPVKQIFNIKEKISSLEFRIISEKLRFSSMWEEEFQHLFHEFAVITV